MAATFVLPLYPLAGQVLLPGEDVSLGARAAHRTAALASAPGFGGAVIASLAEGDSVHEIAVTAIVSESDDGRVSLRGVERCRLVALIDESVPLARAERIVEAEAVAERAGSLARLLQARYARVCQTVGRDFQPPHCRGELAPLTWRVTACIGLSPEQQQGFLNVPDAVTRGQLLLVAVRDLERRERFLRPWARLRAGAAWN